MGEQAVRDQPDRRGDDNTFDEAVTAAAPWAQRVARFGYAAKGAVYLVVGWLAFQAALGTGGRTTDTEGALQSIFRQPLGPVLLLAVGLGLWCYTAWRLLQSLLDVEQKGTSLRGIAKRVGYLVSGLAYGGLGVTAVRRSIGLATTEGRSQEDWTALVLSTPYGRWLVMIAGAVLALLAVNAAVIAVRRLFRRKLDESDMGPAVRRWAHTLAIVGLLARGLVFALLALFFVQAGWQADASQAGGLSDALVALARQPYGPWLLGATAAGLFAYGLFALVQARFRLISVT